MTWLTVELTYSQYQVFSNFLEKEGFKVDTYLHGLGENQNIRNLFVERANEAWDALQK